MHALGCLLTFFLIILIAAFAFVRNILAMLLGGINRNRSNTSAYTKQTKNRKQQTYSQQTSSKAASKSKIISDDEGEYVDFEDIQK